MHSGPFSASSGALAKSLTARSVERLRTVNTDREVDRSGSQVPGAITAAPGRRAPRTASSRRASLERQLEARRTAALVFRSDESVAEAKPNAESGVASLLGDAAHVPIIGADQA